MVEPEKTRCKYLHEENAKCWEDGETVHVRIDRVLASETISAARWRLARFHSKNRSSIVEDRRNAAGGKDERRDSGGDCNCDCAAKTADVRFRAMLGGNVRRSAAEKEDGAPSV